MRRTYTAIYDYKLVTYIGTARFRARESKIAPLPLNGLSGINTPGNL